MFFFSNYSSKSKYYDSSNKLVVGKLKDETADELLGSKRKIYSYLVDDNSEHKKAKGLNKNIVVAISHIKDVLLIKNDWDILWIGFNVKIIKLEFMKSTRFVFLALRIKYISKTMDMMD